MIIGIDGNEANVKQKVGVSVYAFNLLKEFSKKARADLRFIIYLKSYPLSDLPSENINFKYKVIVAPLWSQIFLPLELYKNKTIDVFFTPAHYAPRFCPIPYVVTIHDLSYFYYPGEFLRKDLYKLKHWTRYSIQKAKHIITVSEGTKHDVIKFYKVPEKKLTVVYNGYEKETRNKKQETSFSNNLSYGLKIENYILYVGTVQPRKNISALLKAFAKFKRQNFSFKLVLAGKKGWLYKKIFTQVKDLELEKDVIFTGYLSDERLVQLYSHAFCFVLPSLYEGFGLPLLEAMNNDCPVIASNSSSLPEIGGDACLYFDPQREVELLEKLNQLKNNRKLRGELITKGKEQIKHFSWQKCAQETLEIIKSAL